MTSSILSLINTLTTPLDDASVRDAQSSHQEALLAALQSNRTVVLDRLRSDGDFDVVRKLREEVKSSSSWFDVAADDAAWSFVQECLLLLVVLSRHISRELELFHAAVPKKRPATCESAPPLPPDVLAVNQQKTLRAALQFVVSLGLCPHLSPGVGVPLGRRSAFGAVVEKLASSSSSRRRRRLFATTTVLLELAELSSLATLIFTQHLGDVMAALCQLGYQPPNRESEDQPESKTQELSADERQSCKDALKKLLGKVYQPIVVKELLILQGRPRQGGGGGGGGRAAPGSAPSWLRRLCGQLLSERLMQPNGVQAVVRAILEGGAGGESDWRKCDGVARILVACPQQSTSADGYYQHVCPQILDLLHFKDKLTAQQFQRVATRAALSMVQEKPDFAGQYLLAPLLEPLRRCAAADKESRSEVVVDEWELTRCVEDVYKIWVVGNSPSALLLKSLEEVLPVIFTLYCFTKQNVSHLRATCQDILLWYLNHAETPAAAILALRQLSGLQGRRNEASDFHFTPGSDGGAVFRSRESGNDEDDALYEKLSGEQWRLECLMQLLSELKDSDLPGDFFLELLQELTSWTTTEKGEEEEGGGGLDVAAMTLLEVEQQVLGRVSKRNKKLVLLQVLAVMVETLQHDALLRKTTQAVDFVVTLIQRACSGLDRVSDPDLENPVETQTLTTALSLVATLLTGPELTSDDFSHMSKLLSPLETLSLKHPELFIRDLASNLRVVVATRGSCRPEDLGAAVAAATGDRTDPGTKQKRKQKTQTEAKVDVDRPGKSDPVSGVPRPPDKPLSDWLLEACDPDEPTRAFALRALTHMVENKNPESVRDQDKVLDSFLENLEHEDSFVYLSAIQGLSSLVDRFPDRILERLLRDFQLGPSLSTSNKQRSLETRLKLGEVLMRASRAMGELAPHLGRPLIGVFLQGTRDPDQSVRASSLSNLGELCQKLDYALGPLAQELSSCLTALIKTEKEPEVRRAAVHVVVLLLRGLSSKTTQVLGDVLLDLYRALKWVVRSDPDEVAVLHAQLALEELDDVMKKFIFPEQKLEKKIVVLP